ncbi:dicarboxylate/amino acid:cation symporter [Nitratiruptor sp. SB155-2]|uniref:dicarboxylate/amino acid:cation symporter n=1 Tax=Nitratiruptor sp. (strain SB155-2) TaxID=387092 RepID=UPI0001586E09|nr:dicarboxylate/amino acid:cation symporter [Nitratiruptor sp. SB155-2]BAF69437.1 Na+/H+:dicarboxylate/amino acid symporter [Nitratiruptor sp. SB155-2]
MARKKLFSVENLTLIAIGAGIAFGYFFPALSTELKAVGDIYLKLLKMLIIPLVFASIFIAIASLSGKEELKSIGVKAFLYYLSTTALAVLLGIVIFHLINPGSGEHLLQIPQNVTIEKKELSLSDFLLSFIPANIFEALSKGAILPIIFFTILFAVAALFIQQTKRTVLYNFFDSINDAMMVLARWVIALTPIGVFFLIAATVAKNGLEPIFELYSYVLTVLLALMFHALVTLPSIGYFVGRFNPYRYFLQIKEAPLIAFSTASSSATLPVSLEVAEEKGGVSKKVAGFVLPLGATINMDGTALYESIAVLFIANISGVELSLAQQITIFITVTFASIGAAGIPGAGLIMMTMVLDSVGLPVEAIALIITVDRFLDMFRTAVNNWGDLLGAKLIQKVL